MPLYFPYNYCQECYDLGSAIEKLNDFIRLTYWEICEPKQTRTIYKVLRSQVTRFSTNDIDDEEDVEEEDLFLHFQQESFMKITDYIYTRTLQFPQRDKIRRLMDNVVSRLRDLNNWLESPQGQTANWWRVHDQFQHTVIETFWTNNELMNFVPDDSTENEPQGQSVPGQSSPEQLSL